MLPHIQKAESLKLPLSRHANPQAEQATHRGVEVGGQLHDEGRSAGSAAAVVRAGVQEVPREAGVVSRAVGAGPLAIQQLHTQLA